MKKHTSRLIEKLASVWAVKQELPPHVDVIMFVTMGATAEYLTRGSREIMEEAILLACDCQEAKIAFSAYAFNPTPGLEYEQKRDRRQLRDAIYVGAVMNTAHEAQALFEGVRYVKHQSIVVVTDEWHSRSMAHALRKAFGEENPPTITVVTVPSLLILSPDNPIKALRSHWRWALVNVLRHLFLITIPGSFDLMQRLKVRQPT